MDICPTTSTKYTHAHAPKLTWIQTYKQDKNKIAWLVHNTDNEKNVLV